MQRRQFLMASAASVAALALVGAATARPGRKPNFIVILCDDLGYGDVGAMGGTTIRTPNIDRMARGGVTLTDFYSPANICTPARAGYLTGRYPVRTGLGWQVIQAGDTRGLPLSEVTIAEALKPAGYTSALIGKWHLGHVAPFWPPTQHGFDLFFGLPYSHDMQPLSLYADNGPGVELTKEDVSFPQLQQRFYDRAEKFVHENAAKPFFLMLALSAPHLPNDPNPAFHNHSGAGAYGDVVEEIDSIVGRLEATLRQLGLERDTLVVLTSDNGPWFEGSAGSLRDRKGGAGYDGGYRVPFIARMPGTLPAGRRSNAIAMGIDLMPTFCAMADVPLPAGIEIDGADIGPVLTRQAPTPHDQLLLFDNEEVAAIRTQLWKFVSQAYYRGYRLPISVKRPGLTRAAQLYDMRSDPSENYSLADRNPAVVTDMDARLRAASARFAPFATHAPAPLPVIAPPRD